MNVLSVRFEQSGAHFFKFRRGKDDLVTTNTVMFQSIGYCIFFHLVVELSLILAPILMWFKVNL